ncbi:MAG: phosphatidate cytidylyltransferase [Acidobacteria bacterium]|nr:phosphatidate cytidylyltransferase [Acidobacteriota bacterium]NIM60548.1 phosphatidate cytidylyltransferase [Acidobacteriota bacterium]NIO59519.1 phosphatidate cytidylyltransferase [Acidobacteriota bacterium]NIQ30548.1 phosphatidate cytidylyltransferase [Acidobacteriota bacterium]NIQ85496.1 phosphatidate cytidylyltransferase [Acidobacteriota bacterium]
MQYGPAWTFSLLVGVVVAGGTIEACGILGRLGTRPVMPLCVAFALAIAAAFDSGLPFDLPVSLPLTLGIVTIVAAAMRRRDDARGMLDTIQASLLPPLLVGLMLAHLIGLRGLGDEIGRDLLFLLFLCVMLGDTAAYYVGSAIGRSKMTPVLSPNKSWEGAIAAIFASVAASWLATVWFFPDLPLKHALIIGALLGPAGILGDLAESTLKRAGGVKDSGRLLPGHGGLLDRIDSLLFAAPVLYYYCMAFLGAAP